MKFRLNAIVRASESRTMQISNMRPRRRTQLPSLCQLLLTVIAVPSVVASVIPSAVRTDLDSTNALDLPLSGEIVSDDLQDVSDSPLKERAAWDPVQLDSSPEEADATHSPILLALEENSQTSEDNDNNSQPALSQSSHLLDLSCAADVDQCSSFMTDLASRITKSDACGKDYDLGNPVVTDAYTDMIIYEPMYRASCLKNPSTGDYCFVDAATNSSNPSDYDVYFIPYGSAITNAPYPTCNKCVQASMDVFGEWAQKSGQPLAHSYLPSARSINSKCGVSFANANITVAGDGESSAATWSGRRPDGFLMVWVVALSVGVSLWGWV
ncbi:hypothetical protein BDV35DRAFT_181979 [Aspergillus flavus]|uniref:DUF7729 domain-containing protein n=1 Tax=Aspergillus flavus TaxID=5059 RepID=A0A5N6H0S8_ASPFL|nr:hypothetical protein BDV35DRAFT_181979 [Aspergillus flavus]